MKDWRVGKREEEEKEEDRETIVREERKIPGNIKLRIFFTKYIRWRQEET